MANYTSLKATIDANIKANGRQEITGMILNAVLKAAVDTIGDGYRFVGVVTPTSEAPVSDNRIFVFASTAGTYTNFGLSVASGELCVFYFDTNWHKAVISTGGGGGVDAYTKAETNALLAVKQNASDNALQTADKTIVGAINENKGDIDGKYTKPSGGIPATDMASAVQTSLGKADTALQSQEQADWNETDTTDPAYIKNKPTIPTLPTIATGINARSTNTEVAGAKAVYDFHNANKDIFVAVYGTTTFADVKAAFKAGKTIFCQKMNNGTAMLLPLSRSDGNYTGETDVDGDFNFFNLTTLALARHYTLRPNGSWSEYQQTIDTTQRTVATYPSPYSLGNKVFYVFPAFDTDCTFNFAYSSLEFCEVTLLLKVPSGITAPTVTWNIPGLTWKNGNPSLTAGKTYEISIVRISATEAFGMWVEY